VEDTVALLPLAVVAADAWPFGGALLLADGSGLTGGIEGGLDGSSGSSASAAIAAAAVGDAEAAARCALDALRAVVGVGLRAERLHATHPAGSTDPSADAAAAQCGYFRLVGRGASTLGGAGAEGPALAAWAFGAVAQRPAMVLGSAGGAWAAAVEACTGRAGGAVAAGTGCGEVDCHLGEGLAPGPHAVVKWRPNRSCQDASTSSSSSSSSSTSSSSSGGSYVVVAVGPGCALDGVALHPGHPTPLACGSVLGFGAAAKGALPAAGTAAGTAAAVLVQVLLPLRPEGRGELPPAGEAPAARELGASGPRPGRAAEAAVLAALRLATADADLAAYLPALPDLA
jgi:hypothetical protein